MKKLVLTLLFIISFSRVCYSQRQETTIEFHTILIDWDGWGRTSKECSGFGLCKFRSCLFCCTQNDVIVKCPENQSSGKRVYNAGIVVIDIKSNNGYLTIKLDPEDVTQKNVISNKEKLYIDNDIVGADVILLKGEYLFDSTVGSFGGYKIMAKGNPKK